MNKKTERKQTPIKIEKLKPGQIFVFGSNTMGRHGAGAANTAFRRFGAAYGQPSGLQGHSYAIITTDLSKGPRGFKLAEIYDEIIKFSIFASEHPELKFFVTKIGSNLAGYTTTEIADLFIMVNHYYPLEDNVILPVEYECR